MLHFWLMPRWNALLDTSTNIVLAVSSHRAALTQVREALTDTTIAAGVNVPNYQRTWYRRSFFLSGVAPENYPRWTWSFKTRLFSPTRTELITEALIERARLANTQLDAYSKMIRLLSSARSSLETGIDMQETVYLLKKMQALRFRDANYDERILLDVPFVLQYADLRDIPLKQAADDIIFKAKLDEDLLAKTELLRMKYFKRVRSAKTTDDVLDIMNHFERDYFKNTLT